jgi:hypothetical protein
MTLRLWLPALALATLVASPAAARKPTNDAAAFKTFDLYADRTAVGDSVHDYVNLSSYPSWLNTPSLLAYQGTDTVGYFNSQPYAAIDINSRRGPLGGAGPQVQSYVEYTLNPPAYLSSVGLLVMTYNATRYNATQDSTVPVFDVRVTTPAGDSVRVLRIGDNVRNLKCGINTCYPFYCAAYPWMCAKSADPLCRELYADATYKFDALEVTFPDRLGHNKVSKLRVNSDAPVNVCGGICLRPVGIVLSGLSSWPNFTVLNAQTPRQPVVRQSQTTGHRHGGYYAGDDLVGWRRATDQTGCKITSLAMAYTYAGFSCTVDDVNDYLQRNQGFMPSQVCSLLTVSADGSSVTFVPLTADDTRLKIGDTFLVERGIRTNPLATYQVQSPGYATRLARHNASVIPAPADHGRVYWNSIPAIADRMTPGLHNHSIPDKPEAAAVVESLLVCDVAVQLNVGKGGHWVVADGWTSSFRPDGTARGTYSIKDPFDERNYTKLIEGKYRNSFVQARYVAPLSQLLAASPLAVTTDPPGLSILADGAWRVEVIDPLGRRMVRNAATGEGVYDIPDASIEDVSGEHDNGGDLDDTPDAYDIDVPGAVDGHYTVNVYSNAGLSLSASGYDGVKVFATDLAVNTVPGAVGGSYDILYSAAGQSVTIGYSNPLSVETTPPSSSKGIRALHSPTTGPVEFAVTGLEAAADVIEVFDVGGRRVDALEVSGGPGTRLVTWNWRAAGCGPGVFFARLRSAPSHAAPVVVLR